MKTHQCIIAYMIDVVKQLGYMHEQTHKRTTKLQNGSDTTKIYARDALPRSMPAIA